MGIIIIFLDLEVLQIVGVPRFLFILTKLIDRWSHKRPLYEAWNLWEKMKENLEFITSLFFIFW